MGTVHAELFIDATPEAVWEVLSDIDRWGDWNDVIVDGRTEGGEGGRVSVRVVVAGPLVFPVKSRLVHWDRPEALAWGEHRGRIARIQHGFTLRPEGEGCRVVHYERFEGLVGRLVFPFVKGPLDRNYFRFLEALRARVENPPM